MASPFHPAFLPIVPIPTPSRTHAPSSSTQCRPKRQQHDIIHATAARPQPRSKTPQAEPAPSQPASERKPRWTNAVFATTAASLLALSSPTLTTPHDGLMTIPAAQARGGGASFLSASGEVIKDPEALLRWSLPIKNAAIRSLQGELEAAVNDLRGLKWTSVDSHIKRVNYLLNNQSAKILAGVPEAQTSDASKLLAHVADTIPTVESAVTEKNADKVTRVCKGVLREIGGIEEMMVREFPFKVPVEYGNLPQLRGRATVEMVVKKGGNGAFDINGIFYEEGKLTLVLDGYSAPVSAGNFVDLVNRGFYDGNNVLRSDGFIVQAGKPADGDGFVDKDSGQLRTIPLEVFPKSDKAPLYGMTLEEDGRGAEQTVLPFTSYGTLAMARNEVVADSASSQFFWFLFEPDLTPAGRNLMDGNWAVMGYTTQGENFLREMQKGDVIVSAKVVDGLQNLVSPKSASS